MRAAAAAAEQRPVLKLHSPFEFEHSLISHVAFVDQPGAMLDKQIDYPVPRFHHHGFSCASSMAITASATCAGVAAIRSKSPYCPGGTAIKSQSSLTNRSSSSNSRTRSSRSRLSDSQNALSVYGSKYDSPIFSP